MPPTNKNPLTRTQVQKTKNNNPPLTPHPGGGRPTGRGSIDGGRLGGRCGCGGTASTANGRTAERDRPGGPETSSGQTDRWVAIAGGRPPADGDLERAQAAGLEPPELRQRPALGGGPGLCPRSGGPGGVPDRLADRPAQRRPGPLLARPWPRLELVHGLRAKTGKGHFLRFLEQEAPRVPTVNRDGSLTLAGMALEPDLPQLF
jgi:hypothetical protein